MLRSIKELEGYRIFAQDGEIGHVREFYFDDINWIIQYMVVDTGGILTRKSVLIAPAALGRPDWSQYKFPVSLTREEIENSPDIGEDLPVSRRKEKELLDYYSWPVYWSAPGYHGAAAEVVSARLMEKAKREKESGVTEEETGDPHLRSTREVKGYDSHARDGKIGHVDDFIVDDDLWMVRYLIVNTRDWLPGGRRVLISPRWIKNVDWLESKVVVGMQKEEIENSPEFNPDAPINREYEIRLYDYYGRPKDWQEKK